MKNIGYYMRVSTVEQNTARQEEKVEASWKVYSDKISGTIPFERRPKGKQLLKDVAAGLIDEVKVLHLDRLGRSTENILSTIKNIHEHKVSIHIIELGLHTMIDKKENITAQLLVTILSGISEANYRNHREASLTGIRLAVAAGKYHGRVKGTTEPIEKWAQKPKVQRVKTLLEKGVSVRQIREIMGVSYGLCYKVKELLIKKKRTEADAIYDIHEDRDFRVVNGKAIRKRTP